MLKVVLSFVTGVVFAMGLAIGGMAQPSKVIGFLDVAGDWDPSLAFVMGGAILVFSPLYHLVRFRKKVAFSQVMWLPPPNRPVEWRLVVGSAIFGIGWGLGGYCPGPGLVGAGSAASGALIFVGAMVVGMALFNAVEKAFTQKPSAATPAKATSAPQGNGSPS